MNVSPSGGCDAVSLAHSHSHTQAFSSVCLESVADTHTHTPSARLVAVKEDERFALIKGTAGQPRSSRFLGVLLFIVSVLAGLDSPEW